MNWQYLKRDLHHFAVNPGQTLTGFLFYLKFGFYGWQHLATVLIIQYTVMPFDDWLEGEQPFPYYAAILLTLALYFYPLVTALALVGFVIVNLQALLNKKNFWLERLESVGNVPIYILPFSIPMGINNWQLYTAAVLFILFADCFHKIGHRETSRPDLAWATALIAASVIIWLFATPTLIFFIFLAALLTSLIPFATIKEKKKSWFYTQIWFILAGFIGFYYYLFVVI